jgi:signal transduction histidine kinase/ligand-binding sensor domain-containing protein
MKNWRNKKRVVYVLIGCLVCSFWIRPAEAQNHTVESGYPAIRNFYPSEYQAHNQNFCILQDSRGLMYFGNFAGILEYDGIHWNLICTEHISRVSSLDMDEKGSIYVGARGETGVLRPDEKGTLTYSALQNTEKKSFSDVKGSYVIQGITWFFSENSILKYRDTLLLNRIECLNPIVFSARIGEKVYFQKKGEGLFQLQNDKISKIAGTDIFSEAVDIKAMFLLPDNETLIATNNQGIFLLNKNGIRAFVSEATKMLIEARITCGLLLPKGEIALGTLRNGIFIIKNDGRLHQIINKDAGLADNHIHNLFADKQEHLWAALNKGIALIRYPSPFSFFNEKNGINGTIKCINRHQGTLYVGTTQGLFRFNKNTDQVESFSALNTGTYVLYSDQDLLLAGTGEGLFEIHNDRLSLLSDLFILSMARDPVKKNLFYLGTSKGVYTISKTGNTWNEAVLTGDKKEEIWQIAVDQAGIWGLTSAHGLLRIYQNENRYYGTDKGLPSLLGNQLQILDGDLYISTLKGLYEYNAKTDSFVPGSLFASDTVAANAWYSCIRKKGKGEYWIIDGDEKGLALITGNNEKGYSIHRKPFLPLSNINMNVLFQDMDGTLWSGGSDALIKYEPQAEKAVNSVFIALIREVNINNDSILFSGTFVDEKERISPIQNTQHWPQLTYTSNTLQFKYASAFYDPLSEIRFQYILEGFDKTWSKWTTENQKEYTNLPPGSYVFRVRAKNIYDTVSEEAAYAFRILKPWYSMWWAYILYVSALFLCLYYILKWRSRQLLKEKQVLENIVKERTAEVVEQKEELEHKSLELLAKNDELNKINTIVKSINTQLHFATLLQSILEKTQVIRGMDRGAVLTYDKEEEIYRYKAAFGWDAETLTPIKMNLDEAEHIYLRETREIYEDIFFMESGKNIYQNALLQHLEPSVSAVIMAVKIDNTLEGFLILENLQQHKGFDDQDFSLINNLKEHIISAFIKTRILENLQNTLNHLKETQVQLVESEKLASLGQMTAGIAHEIKNPLNFVNNFSVLNGEMIEELLEVLDESKDSIPPELYDEIQEITQTIVKNSQKINEHGTRASDIVANMLKHSRSQDSEEDFQEVQINKLIEDYVKLAYHGVRAENKDFNTAIKSDFDESIPKVRVIADSFSRVIVNIVNNGCYAVNEKKKQLGEAYSPEIYVSTKKVNKELIIRIRDNGTGMPEKVRNKIFNPFFTTKPAGKGTGLGLSMSFDTISKVHKGRIEVDSLEGEFTEFIITIPLNL